MCFTIPLKVLKIKNKSAIVENGLTVRLGSEITSKPGDYLQVVGNIAVRNFTSNEGKKIRNSIAQLNTPYVS